MSGRAMINVLNVRAGDTSVTFDPSNPGDAEAAREAIESLLRSGHMVFAVNEEGTRADRVFAFEPRTASYIVGGKETAAQKPDLVDAPRPKRRRRRVPAEGTRAVSVGRSAGGFLPPSFAALVRAAREQRS